jgi:hypothetical protein
MGTRRIQVFSVLLAAAFFISVPRAEAARIQFNNGDEGMIIWDGADDVSSMNSSSETNPLLGILNANELLVTMTNVGDPLSEAPRVFFMVTGAPQSGFSKLQSELCIPSEVTCADDYNRVLARDYRNGTTGQNQFPDDDPDTPDVDENEQAKKDFFGANRLAFGAFLDPVFVSDTLVRYNLLQEIAAFNALLPLDADLRFGLIPFLPKGSSFGFDVEFEATRVVDTAPAPIPEPSSMILLGSGLAAAAMRRRKARAQAV